VPSKRVLIVASLALAAVLFVGWVLLRSPGRRELAAPAGATQQQGEVLLVPGYGGGTGELQILAQDLADQGIRSRLVDIGDGTGDLRGYAATVERQAAHLIATGQPVPDVIGYSAGGLIARIAADEQPGSFRKVVTIGTPHHGTQTAEFGALFGDCPAACQQMRPDAELLETLPEPGSSASWLSIWSESDEVIRPPDSSEVGEAISYPLQAVCPGDVRHGELPGSPQTAAAVTAFLSGSALPQQCVAR
jgi:triacylglycerol lipase